MCGKVKKEIKGYIGTETEARRNDTRQREGRRKNRNDLYLY